MQRLQGEQHFRWRGGDVSRIEGLTDAVFALSLTLLMVSVEVPGSYAEMRQAFFQLPAFLACFAVLVWCWYHHFIYHRRYGLENVPTVFLNAAFLFLVLLYVFPLKFLFTLLLGRFLGLDVGAVPTIESHQWPELMLIYSGGFTGIFLLLAAMYGYAWRRRETFELDELERFVTRSAIQSHLLSASFGVVSLALVLTDPGWAPWAGLVYALMGPLHGLRGYLTGRALEMRLAGAGEGSADSAAGARSDRAGPST
jgi:uncharacterized membrane protein